MKTLSRFVAKFTGLIVAVLLIGGGLGWIVRSAHIQRDAVSGEYRLFNDRWYPRGGDCGAWIVRDGMSQEVHRNARGTKLEAGDEIHLGKAVVVFEL